MKVREAIVEEASISSDRGSSKSTSSKFGVLGEIRDIHNLFSKNNSENTIVNIIHKIEEDLKLHSRKKIIRTEHDNEIVEEVSA